MKINVILTRTTKENEHLAQEVKLLGFNPIFSPMLSYEIIDYDFHKFSHYTDIIITSKFAAKILSQKYMYNVNVWVIGKESASILEKNNHLHIAQIYHRVEDMLSSPLFQNIKKEYCLYFSGNYITQEIPLIPRYIIYNTHYVKKLPDEVLKIIKQNTKNFIMFYSKNSVQNFVNLIKHYNHLQNLQNSVVIAISQEVGEMLIPYVKKVLFPTSPNSKEMIKLLKSN